MKYLLIFFDYFLGTFKLKQSNARVGRNPQTGEALNIGPSKSVSFTASSNFKIKTSDTSKAKSKTTTHKVKTSPKSKK